MQKKFTIPLGLAIYVAMIGSVAIFWNQPNLLLGITVCLAALTFALSLKRETLTVFTIGAICGPLSEIVAIHFGAWQYSAPQFLGIPFWLIPVWGVAAVAFTKLADLLGQQK